MISPHIFKQGSQYADNGMPLVTYLTHNGVILQTLLVNLKFASPCIIIQFKYIIQLDATISQIYYLTFMYSSTCFGRPHAHLQELNNCSSSLWFYRWSVVVAVLLVVVGPASQPDHNQQHCYHEAPMVNQRLLLQLSWLLMMDMRMPETC